MKESRKPSFDLNAFVDSVIARIAADVAKRVTEAQGARPRLLTVAQAGRYLGRSEWAVRSLAASGAFPQVRADNRVQFDIKDLDRWIDENKVQNPR